MEPAFLKADSHLACAGHTRTDTEGSTISLGDYNDGFSLFSFLSGFSIKAVPFPNAILNVKELGGKK